MPFIIKIIIWFYARLHKKKFAFPIEDEENLAYSKLKDLLWIGYKMQGHPIEHGEKGQHLEEYFADQDFDFSTSPEFFVSSSLVLSAGGDLLSSRDANPDNTTHLWDDVKDYLFNSDFRCANLETPVMPSRSATFLPEKMTKHFALNNSPQMFDVFYRDGGGINFFSTANNHSMDMGEEGLLETLDFLRSRGCGHVGTSSSEQEREDFPIIETNGIKLALLSYTYSLNGKKVPEGKEYLVNYIRLNKLGTDLSMIERHVRQARLEKKADFVIACLHWSREFESYPLRSLIDTGHQIMAFGVDVILGNHAHNIQPLERVVYVDPFTGLEKNGLIVYALGDLISCTEKTDSVPNSRMGNLLRLEISKGDLKGNSVTQITDLKMKPVYFYTRMENGTCHDYRVMDLMCLLDELNNGINRMELSSTEIAEVQRLGSLGQKVLNI